MNEVLTHPAPAYKSPEDIDRERAETIASLEEHGFALQWVVEFPSPPTKGVATRMSDGEVMHHKVLGALSASQQARLERIMATHQSYIRQVGAPNVRAVTPTHALAERAGFDTVGPGLVAFMVRTDAGIQ